MTLYLYARGHQHTHQQANESEQLAPMLSFIYQQSLDDPGEVPLDWRKAHVVPILRWRTIQNQRTTDVYMCPSLINR